MQKDNTQINILDSLRAFAVLSVCLFHFVCTTTGFINTKWVLDFFSLGKYGVQLFFVISGFVIPWAMFNAGFENKFFFKFLSKRFIRLEPPYLLSVFLTLCLIFLRHKFSYSGTSSSVTSNQIFLHFGYLIPFFEGYNWLNEVYWTLAIEFQYYIFIALLFVILKKSNLMTRIFIYVFILAISFINHLPIYFINYKEFLPYWLPVFLLGIMLFLFFSKIISKKEYIIVSAVLLVFCVFKYPLGSVIYSCIPIVCIHFWKNSKLWGLDMIGRFSYSIYLFHALLGGTFINVMSHTYHSDFSKILIISLGIIITLLGSYCTYLLIEKPSKKLSAKIKYNNI